MAKKIFILENQPEGLITDPIAREIENDTNVDFTALDNRELLSNKQNVLIIDGTGNKYPTLDLMNATLGGLATVTELNNAIDNINSNIDLIVGQGVLTPEIRPSDWLEIDSLVVDGDTKFVGLHAVYNNQSNFVTVRCTTSSGLFSVNWGDGVTTTHASGTTAERNLVFSDYNISTQTLYYRQAIITVTGNITGVDLVQKHSEPNLPNGYTTGWLDIKMSGSQINSIVLWSAVATTTKQRMLFGFNFIGANLITNALLLFGLCTALKQVNINTSSVTNMQQMFDSCFSLQTIPLLNTALVTNMQSMFQSCSSLQTIPALQAHPSLTTVDYTSFVNGCITLSACGIIGIRNNISFANCRLSTSALVDIFNNLETVTAKTITISGNFGASALTASDRLIATNKGWTIIG